MNIKDAKDLLEMLGEALGAVGEKSSELSKIDANLKVAQEGVAKSINLEASAIKTADAALQKALKSKEKLKVSLMSELTLSDKRKKLQAQIAIAYGEESKELSNLLKQLSDTCKKEKEFNDLIDKATGKTKEHIDVISKMGGAISKSVGIFSKLISVIGVAGFSLSGLTKFGLDYSKSLIGISKMQNAVGSSSNLMSGQLEQLASSTNLSTIQFAQFATVIQETFVGIRPTLDEMAKLSNILKTRVGPSAEAQIETMKSLADIQSKFPSLYQDTFRAMELLNKKDTFGKITESEEKEIATLKQLGLQRMMIEGKSSGEIAKYLSLLGERTQLENQAFSIQEKHQAATAAMQEAQLKLYKAAEPILKKIMEITTSVLNVTKDYSTIILGLGIGIPILIKLQQSMALLRTTSNAVNLSNLISESKTALIGVKALGLAMKNAVLAINPVTVALAAAGVALMALDKWTDKLAEETEKLNQFASSHKDYLKEINSLTQEELKEVNKILATTTSTADSEEILLKKRIEAVSQIKGQRGEGNLLFISLTKMTAEMDAQLKIVNKIKEGYKEQVSLISSFGGVDLTALKGVVSSTKQAAELSGNALKTVLSAALDTVGKDIKEKFNITPTMDIDALYSATQQIVKNLEKNRALVSTDKERENIDAAINQIMQKNAAFIKEQSEHTKALINEDNARIKQQEEITSIFESRLDTERKLMEVAQFGMGASVSMMQKQVDLAYELMQGYEAGNRALEKRLINTGKISRSQIEQIKNAKTMKEAEYVINNSVNDRNESLKQGSNEQLLALNLAKQYQEYTKKSMDQQIKIYELTKEIREGYLDAVREMSSGLGEFEKIIGTQEMGVTQLMKYVDQFSKGALNTMKTGGLQSAETTGKGVGTEITGTFGAGGPALSFVGGRKEAERNKRIYGFQEAKDRYNQMRSGEGGPSEVGAALGAGEGSQYLRPVQEEIEIGQKGNEKVEAAIIRVEKAITNRPGGNLGLVSQALVTGSGRVGTYEKNDTSLGFPLSVSGVQERIDARRETAEYKNNKAYREAYEMDIERRSEEAGIKFVKGTNEPYGPLMAKPKEEKANEKVKDDIFKKLRLKIRREIKGESTLPKFKGYMEEANPYANFGSVSMKTASMEMPKFKFDPTKISKTKGQAGSRGLTAAENEALKQGEIDKLARGMRQDVGDLPMNKGESKSAYQKRIRGEATAQAAQVDFSTISAEKAEMLIKARNKAGTLDYSKNGLSPEASKSMLMESKQKGYTSAAAAKGQEASAQDQAYAASAQNAAQKDAMGISGEEVASGTGVSSGKILVELSDDLKGTVQEMKNIVISITAAAAAR